MKFKTGEFLIITGFNTESTLKIFFAALLGVLVLFSPSLFSYTPGNSTFLKDTLSLLERNPPADEILLQVNSRDVGNLDVSAYMGDNKVYIPLINLFNFLSIKCEYSNDFSAVEGFFITQDLIYHLDLNGNMTTVGDSSFMIPRDNFYLTENEVFMNSALFEKLFGLKLLVDLRSLSVNMYTDKKLPAVIEYEREIMRRNIQKLTTEITAEKNIPLNKNWLSGFLMDWNINYITTQGSASYSYTNSIGAEIAGGDFQGTFSGDNNRFFSSLNNNWRWRFVYDGSPYFKQGLIGDVYSRIGQTANLKGFELTNSPVNSRRLFGEYKISDQTYPNWKVELYLNNILVKYTITDSSGIYNFNIPMPYGMNFISIKLYGPNGEQQVIERVIQTPFSIIPKGEVEYSLVGGKLKYFNRQDLYELSLKWGVFSNLSLGTGLQYLGSRNLKYIPDFNLLYKPGINFYLSFDYVYQVKTTGTFNVVFPSLVTGELSLTRFGRESFNAQPMEERKLSIFLPLRFKHFSSSVRYMVVQNIVDSYRSIYNNLDFSLYQSGFQFELNSNLAFFKTGGKYKQSFSNSSISLGHRIFFNYLLRGKTDLDHFTGKLVRVSFNLDGNLLNKGWLSFSIYKNIKSNNFGVQAGFTYELPFAHSISNYFNDHSSAYQQGLYGNVSFDQSDKKFLFDNQNWVGTGGVRLVPFIDKNNNDIIDENEQELNTEFRPFLETGRLIKDEANVYRFIQLEAYNSYLLNIEPYSFSDPVYRPKYKSFLIKIAPDQYESIDIPVFASCDIMGNVTLKKGNVEAGMQNFKVFLESEDGKTRKETLTFSDGSYSFDGLMPGIYNVYIRKSDWTEIKTVLPADSIPVKLEASDEGTFVDGINFLLLKDEN